jgi:anti-sigma factor RsiW
VSSFEQGMAGHRRAWELIPWVVNGRATDEDRALVETHLRDCRDCREEFAFQVEIQQAISQEAAAEAAAPPSLDRLWSRIDGADQRTGRRASSTVQRWLVAAVVVEAIGLGALAFAFWREPPADAPYRTLSLPAAAPTATLRIVLMPKLELAVLQKLLDEEQLQIVGGPSEAGVYSLAPRDRTQPIDPAGALARLRAHPGVRFAEPVAATP